VDEQRWTSRGGRAEVDEQRWTSRGGRAEVDEQRWTSRGGRAEVDEQRAGRDGTGVSDGLGYTDTCNLRKQFSMML
jgi:hypothetical protein